MLSVECWLAGVQQYAYGFVDIVFEKSMDVDSI